MKGIGRWTLLIAALVLVMGLGGCGKQEEPLEDGEASYQVYYLNSSMTRLVEQEYRTRETDPEGLAEELIACLRSAPPDLDVQVVLPEKVMFQGAHKEDVVLYLNFDANYASMEASREILCRAALTKTLTQIGGVEYISIYSGGQPLLNRSGMPVGVLSAADFVDGISDINAYERAELTLYFTDGEGQLLYPESRSVVHSVNTSVERVIVEELLAGPEGGRLAPTLESGVKLLNVSVNENVCYLNFDGRFLKNSLEVADYIPIYSLVNSLTTLPSVNRVQITVDGSQDVPFRDKIPLSTVFERNLDYIGGQDH